MLKWKGHWVKDSKPKITRRCVIEEEIKEFSKKPLHSPPGRNDPLVNKLEYEDTKKTLQA